MCSAMFDTPTAVMKTWDMLGDMSVQTAKAEYVALLDRILPKWNAPLDEGVELSLQVRKSFKL